MSIEAIIRKLPAENASAFHTTMLGDSVVSALDCLNGYNWSPVEKVQLARHYGWTPARIATAFHAIFDNDVLRQPLVGFSANILPYLDPFEFTPKTKSGKSGSYGPFVDHIKDEVEKRIIEKSVGQKNPSAEDLAFDANYGPNLGDFFPLGLWEHFCVRAGAHNARAAEGAPKYDMANMEKIGALFQKMRPHRFSHFAKNSFPPFTAIDKALRDKAVDQGRDFDAPFVSSCGPLVDNPKLVIDWFFKENAIGCAESPKIMETKWSKLKPDQLKTAVAALKRCYGDSITEEECKIFLTPEGQVAFYLIYQLLNNYLVRDIAEDVNKGKVEFNNGLGSSTFRARIYQQKFKQAMAMLVGAQECKNPVFAELMEEVGFLPTAQQESSDGSKVFLHRDFFEPGYEVQKVTVLNRLGEVDQEGRAMGVVGTRKGTGQKVFAGSCHGSAKDPSDILRQIEALKMRFEELQLLHPDLVFVLFVDANTTCKEEEKAFLEALKTMGLQAAKKLSVRKTRAVTNMHDKSYVESCGTKDYIVVPEWQGLEHESVAFGPELVGSLPDDNNPSDHAAKGAVIIPMKV